ncbi:MAG: hypothetical protein M1826_005773 [Phylliscum demangeonii]|nr:MAG: hypothetical protein M1826_005773 [Phylliscum demangeonii]
MTGPPDMTTSTPADEVPGDRSTILRLMMPSFESLARPDIRWEAVIEKAGRAVVHPPPRQEPGLRDIETGIGKTIRIREAAIAAAAAVAAAVAAAAAAPVMSAAKARHLTTAAKQAGM